LKLCCDLLRHKEPVRLLVVKPEGKRPLGRPRCGSVDNIRMDHGEVGWGGLNWSGPGYVQVQSSFLRGNENSGPDRTSPWGLLSL
jgi:hypothetical protein